MQKQFWLHDLKSATHPDILNECNRLLCTDSSSTSERHKSIYANMFEVSQKLFISEKISQLPLQVQEHPPVLQQDSP